MYILEETRHRLACCEANTGDGWGEAQSLRYHMIRVERQIKELKPFIEEVRRLGADDALVTDPITIDLVNEYRGLLAVRNAAYEFLGVEIEEAEPEPIKGETFAEFLRRLLA